MYNKAIYLKIPPFIEFVNTFFYLVLPGSGDEINRQCACASLIPTRPSVILNLYDIPD